MFNPNRWSLDPPPTQQLSPLTLIIDRQWPPPPSLDHPTQQLQHGGSSTSSNPILSFSSILRYWSRHRSRSLFSSSPSRASFRSCACLVYRYLQVNYSPEQLTACPRLSAVAFLPCILLVVGVLEFIIAPLVAIYFNRSTVPHPIVRSTVPHPIVPSIHPVATVRLVHPALRTLSLHLEVLTYFEISLPLV